MTEAAAFLRDSAFGGWQVQPMAGDASDRRFARLTGPDGATAILMDGGPGGADACTRFIAIARHLAEGGLAAPAIHLADPAAGLAVVGDLGPATFADWLQTRPQDSVLLYGAAVEVLAALTRLPPPDGLDRLDPLRGAAMIAPLFDWYAPGADPRGRALVTGRLQEALMALAPEPGTLSLRDFHAGNLIWRPDRRGTDRVGLLDFQDAHLAPAEYDLASLLRDARRDVEPSLRVAMTDRFARLTGRPVEAVLAASAVLGVQRNLRILGIFARLARRDGKPRYLDFMPRVWRLIRDDLAHPGLGPLAEAVLAHVPAPEAP